MVRPELNFRKSGRYNLTHYFDVKHPGLQQLIPFYKHLYNRKESWTGSFRQKSPPQPSRNTCLWEHVLCYNITSLKWCVGKVWTKRFHMLKPFSFCYSDVFAVGFISHQILSNLTLGLTNGRQMNFNVHSSVSINWNDFPEYDSEPFCPQATIYYIFTMIFLLFYSYPLPSLSMALSWLM